MTGITHKQAGRYLRTAADGLLRDSQRALLDAHLRNCASCRAEADELTALEARLKKNFQARWDAHDGPSKNVLTNIQSQTRRIIMMNRFNTGLKTLTVLAALLLLGLLFNSVFRQLQEYSQQNDFVPGSASSSNLIAFTSEKTGDPEIYTMYADGSNVINLTNNLANDTSPAWSPDGTRIAFTSDRSGDTDIYVMNADGSNVSRLTDDRGFEGFFSWSPDGQKIAYTSGENSLNDAGQLIVMNADGSNKIALTSASALGSYTFLDWSPDSQKIVYQIPNFGHDENDRIMIANVDGTSTFDGITGIDFGVPRQFRWENPEQVVLLGYNFNTEPPGWQLSRMFITSDTTVYNRFGPTIITSNSPIVALFEKTYVVENQDSLSWFVYSGAPIPLSPWKFSETCKTPGDPYLQETSHFISPDKKYSFVSVYCGDGSGTVSFFLMNEDGTEIHQLGKPVTNGNSLSGDVSWSPDGKYVTMLIADRQGQDVYLFDIEKMLNDPSTQPVQLTTDGAMKYGVAWQPQP